MSHLSNSCLNICYLGHALAAYFIAIIRVCSTLFIETTQRKFRSCFGFPPMRERAQNFKRAPVSCKETEKVY